MATPYLPREDSRLVVWFFNLQSKIDGYKALFGITPAEVTAIQDDYNALAYMVNQVELIKDEAQERVGYKDLIKNGPIGTVGGAFPGVFTPPAAPAVIVAPGIVPRIRKLARRLKAHANYTTAIGQDLGIIAAAVPPIGIPKPTGKARSLTGSQVEIRFIKAGFSGVRAESRRGGETEWSYLGTFISSPFIDDRPPLEAGQPEIRSYRLIYMRGNTQVGDPSDTLTVTTTP